MLLHGRLILNPAQLPRSGWLWIKAGRIVEIGEGDPPQKPDHGNARSLICPGFIDAHLHLPQVDSIGYDGLELLDWLDRVIFPAEIRWHDENVALSQIATAHSRLIRAGTLGYAGYLTSHPHGLTALATDHAKTPLRALAGQVQMDRNGPPELINQKTVTSNAFDTGSDRLEVSLNPRFAISCTDDLLARAGQHAKDGRPIQTHLAESDRECDAARKLFPDDAHYTAVYDRHQLLSEHTLLAHCVHLSEPEWQLIAERNCVVVHCPTANIFLRSGLFDLNQARQHNVRLGLGSDVAAGPDHAMPRVARAMIETAKARSMTVAPDTEVPSPAQAWNLITRGNADALGWSDGGRLEVGAAADLLLLEPPFEIDEHYIGKLIYTWRDAYISTRIINGIDSTVQGCTQ